MYLPIILASLWINVPNCVTSKQVCSEWVIPIQVSIDSKQKLPHSLSLDCNHPIHIRWDSKVDSSNSCFATAVTVIQFSYCIYYLSYFAELNGSRSSR